MSYLSKTTISRFFIKEKLELLFWKYRKFVLGNLSGHHYIYFYTEYFSLNKNFYAGKKILDIGCGPRGSLEWADMAKERTGLDPLALHYLKMGATTHQMNYIKGHAENMPFRNNYFDVITSFNSLDHVDNVEHSCKEIRRVLKPNGIFLLIADIHHHPTPTEPHILKWNLPEQYFGDYEIQQKKQLKKTIKNRIYSSIKMSVPITNPCEEGILTAMLQKPAV